MRRDIEMTSNSEKSNLEDEILNETTNENINVEVGKECLEKKDYAGAVDIFTSLCDDIVPAVGDLHDSLGEIYLYYGQALLGLARTEMDVVGTLGKQFDEDENDSSSDDNIVDSTTDNTEQTVNNDTPQTQSEENSKVVTAESKNITNSDIDKKISENANLKNTQGTKDENDGSKVNVEDKISEDKNTDKNKIDDADSETKHAENKTNTQIDTTVQNGTISENKVEPSVSNGIAKNKSEDGKSLNEKEIQEAIPIDASTSSGIISQEKVEENTDEAEGDISNLQLAWEVLELAKKIFSARNIEGNPLLIETLYYLGDVSFESENFETAINDFLECIQMQEKYSSKDRRLADTYFKTGLAYLNCDKYNDALKLFRNAKETLIKYVEELKPKSDSEKDKENYDSECSELQDIIKEINNKIQDVEECLTETRKSVRDMLKEIPTPPSIKNKTDNEASTSSDASSSKVKTAVQANNITHLLRRKRPLDDATNEAIPSKKPASINNSDSSSK